ALLDMVVKKSEGYSVEQLERLYSLLSQCIYQYRREYDKTQLLENPIWSSAAAAGCQCRQQARNGSVLVPIAKAGCQDVREEAAERGRESGWPGGAACRQAGWWWRRADLSADGVDYTLLPVETTGTISALYTITGRLRWRRESSILIHSCEMGKNIPFRSILNSLGPQRQTQTE
ncbi:hypothetical protein INR49_027043, partial [Caranx melampygus]